MASAAEQLAANIKLSSFTRSPELMQRIWFTLGALIVYRLGHLHPASRHRPGGFRSFVRRPEAGRPRPLQHVLRRRRAAHGGVRLEHHALHFGVDHHSALELGAAATCRDQERRRGRAKSPQPIYPLSHRHSRRVPGLRHRLQPRGPPGHRQRAGPDVSGLYGDHAHRRDDVPRLARRTDHLARRRQRLVADHFLRHRREAAAGAGAIVRLGGARHDVDGAAARHFRDGVDRDRLHRLHGARAAAHSDHLSAPAGRQQDVRGAELLPAVEAEHRGRDSAHFRFVLAAAADDRREFPSGQRRREQRHSLDDHGAAGPRRACFTSCFTSR